MGRERAGESVPGPAGRGSREGTGACSGGFRGAPLACPRSSVRRTPPSRCGPGSRRRSGPRRRRPPARGGSRAARTSRRRCGAGGNSASGASCRRSGRTRGPWRVGPTPGPARPWLGAVSWRETLGAEFAASPSRGGTGVPRPASSGSGSLSLPSCPRTTGCQAAVLPGEDAVLHHVAPGPLVQVRVPGRRGRGRAEVSGRPRGRARPGGRGSQPRPRTCSRSAGPGLAAPRRPPTPRAAPGTAGPSSRPGSGGRRRRCWPRRGSPRRCPGSSAGRALPGREGSGRTGQAPTPLRPACLHRSPGSPMSQCRPA